MSDDDVTFPTTGGPMTIRHAVIYRDRTWWERWFSWPWRPWRRTVIVAVQDFDQSPES